MKVAVSIPDAVFTEVEVLVKRLKVTRSEIYARALKVFVATHAPDRLTEAMNDAIDAVGETEADDFVHEAGHRVFDRTEW